MIVVLKQNATGNEIINVLKSIKKLGFQTHISTGEERTIIGIIGNERVLDPSTILTLNGVEKVIPVLPPFKLVSRDFKHKDTIITLSEDIKIGAQDTFTVIAGPCAIESEEQIYKTAKKLKSIGVNILRGGAYKPRTSPYSFRGLGKEGLSILKKVKKELNIKIITELLYIQELENVLEVTDIIQIGARNMQNYELLEVTGKTDKPILLKRGFSNTIEELLLSAEYIMLKGNSKLILCERGIRTFEKYTRNTLDIAAVPVIRRLSHLPIIVDPSHAAGDSEIIPHLANAATASGANGIIVEVHPNPQTALCDGAQSLKFETFIEMYNTIKNIAKAIGKTLN